MIRTVERVVTRGVHGEADVGRHIAVGHFELGLRRAVDPARRVDRSRARLWCGRRRIGAGTTGARHDDHVAHAELDRGRGAPDRGDGRCAAEVDPLGEVDRPSAVLGDRRRMEHGGLTGVADAHEAVDFVRLDAGIGERAGGEIGPLLERELARAGEGPL